MAAIREPFGQRKDGRAVERITLHRGRLEAEVLTYGGTVAAVRSSPTIRHSQRLLAT